MPLVVGESHLEPQNLAAELAPEREIVGRERAARIGPAREDEKTGAGDVVEPPLAAVPPHACLREGIARAAAAARDETGREAGHAERDELLGPARPRFFRLHGEELR